MLLEGQAEGKPYCVAISGRHAPWSRYMLSPTETKIAYAMAVSNGAWTWYGVYNDNKFDKVMDTVKTFNIFINKNKDCYENTKSVSKTALVWSYNTANYYQTSAEETDFTRANKALRDNNKGDHKSSFDGWFDVLSRSHQIFDVIDNTALVNGDLEKYNLLILPAVSCISREEANSIKDFVKNGGNLISSFDTSFYDEHGIENEVSIRKNLYDHIDISTNSSVLLYGIDQTLIPAASLGVQCTNLKNAEPIAYFRKLQTTRYCELPDESKNPYIIFNKYGKGKSIYFLGNVDSFYNEYSLPEYRVLLNNAVNFLSEKIIDIEVESNIESIHITLRKKNNKTIIHLINYTGSMTRQINGVVKIRNTKITLLNYKHKNINVYSLWRDKKLEYKYVGNNLIIDMEEMGEYEVVVVEEIK